MRSFWSVNTNVSRCVPGKHVINLGCDSCYGDRSATDEKTGRRQNGLRVFSCHVKLQVLSS